MFKNIKQNCRNKEEVYNFNNNLNQNIIDILYKLYNHTYKFGKYRIFLIKEPKYRLIMSENVSDKLVNHLVSKYILLPSLEKSLIYQNVATRCNKGSSLAYKLFIEYIKSYQNIKETPYILKIDIKKYFYNIDHNICINLIKEKIKDKEALNIIEEILNTTNSKYVNEEIKKVIEIEKNKVLQLNISNKEKEKKINELNKIPLYKYNKGLSIGNMTSQILAVFYLNKIDHYIKEELKCKNYIRYMDDLLIISSDKNKLKNVLNVIREKLKKELKLEVNNKSSIYSIKEGVSFLGYNFKLVNNKLIIRYNNITSRRINKRLNNLKKYDYNMYIKSKGSYKGFIDKCNTNLKFKLLNI